MSECFVWLFFSVSSVVDRVTTLQFDLNAHMNNGHRQRPQKKRRVYMVLLTIVFFINGETVFVVVVRFLSKTIALALISINAKKCSVCYSFFSLSLCEVLSLFLYIWVLLFTFDWKFGCNPYQSCMTWFVCWRKDIKKTVPIAK